MREKISSELWKKSFRVKSYPPNIVPIKQHNNIQAFFPGGTGDFAENSNKKYKILVLGHIFSDEKYYREIIERKRKDIDCPTSKNLLQLFKDANINYEECYFSNTFMGLKKDNNYKFQDIKLYKDFVHENLENLDFQIQKIKPLLIITLGKIAAEMLYELSKDNLKKWKNIKVTKIGQERFMKNVNFNGGVTCNCIALVQPCYPYFKNNDYYKQVKEHLMKVY